MSVDLFGTPCESKASFSSCRRYRYDLWRRWAVGPYAMFIGLNPSTADETQDDPTIRRCINFAKAWGYSALCMTNLFAFRATDPRDMKAEPFPIGGHENDLALRSLSESAGIVIAAWGVHGTHLDRASDVVKMIPNLQCLGLSKDGHPRHPLYLKADCKPLPLNANVDASSPSLAWKQSGPEWQAEVHPEFQYVAMKIEGAWYSFLFLGSRYKRGHTIATDLQTADEAKQKCQDHYNSLLPQND